MPSASVAIGSVSLASDGKTLTGTLSGGTGTGYAPAAGVTSFAMTVDGNARNFQSSTISGSTWTGIAYTPIRSTATVVLVKTTGNLVDSGSNTIVTGNTSVTNNSTKGSADELAALVNIPATSLDGWYTARNAASANRVEIPVIGDSTTADSGASYSWVYKVRALAIAAGYTNGGRGAVENFDSAGRSGPTDNLSCIQSQTGFADGSQLYSALFNAFQSITANDTVTLQGYGTAIRLHYDFYSSNGKFSYSVDGGTPVLIDALNGSSVETKCILISGLSAGLHTITVLNFGYSDYPPLFMNTSGGSTGNTGLWTESGPHYYVMTGLTAAGETQGSDVVESIHATFQGSSSGPIRNPGYFTGYNRYRSTSPTGPFYFLSTVAATGGTFTFFPADNGDVPLDTGRPAPSINTAGQYTAASGCNFSVDFMNSTGLVWHKDAVSGAAYSNYGLDGAYNNYPYQEILGLTHVDGSTTPDTRPPHRDPKLAVCALGINGQQGGDAYTSAVQIAAAKFITAAIGAGAIPITVIPHYSRANSPFTAKAFIDGQKAAAVAASTPWFDFNVALDLAGYGLGGPHLDQTGYDLEGSSIWDNLLSGGPGLGPALDTATINDNSTYTLVFSEAVTGVDIDVAGGKYTLDNGLVMGTPTSGDGGITWIGTLSPFALASMTVLLNYSGGTTTGADGDLADIVDEECTNDSTAVAPEVDAVAIDATGAAMFVVFSKSISDFSASPFTINANTVYALSNPQFVSGNNWQLTVTPPIQADEVLTFDLDSNTIVDAGGYQTTPVTAGDVTNSSMQPPRIPTSMNVVTGGTETQIVFDAVPSGGGVTSYTLERSIDQAVGWTSLTPPDVGDSTYHDTDTADGTLYYYRLQAHNSGGGSSYATAQGTAEGPLGRPTAPANLAIAADAAKIALTWDSQASVDSFLVYRTTHADYSGLSLVTTTAGNATGFNDVLTIIDLHYYYRVIAHNDTLGNSDPSDADVVSQGPLKPHAGGGGKSQNPQVRHVPHLQHVLR